MNSNNLEQWWENTYRHHQEHLHHSQSDLAAATNHYIDGNANQKHFDLSTVAASSVSGAFAAITGAASALEAHLKQANGNGLTGKSTEQIYNYDGFDNLTLMNPYDDIANGFDKDEESSISSLTLLFMAISYGLVVFGGVLGNATLMLTLCSASSTRLRNPLLLAVCFADLLVTGISAPVTLFNLAMNRKTKSLPLVVCKVIHYVQIMPVAASTISFFMLSLDRYATVKHPRLAQLRQRRYLHLTLALLSWIASAAISAPFLFAYKIIAKTVQLKNSNSLIASASNHHANLANLAISLTTTSASLDDSNLQQPHNEQQQEQQYGMPISPNVSISCTSELGANAIFVSFIIFHTIAVFIIPGFGVLLNHYGVRRKLCALSLTARAAHGELPLPMPILRRQTNMVIVTGLVNAQQAAAVGCGTTDDTSNCGGDIQLHNLNPSGAISQRNIIKTSNPISPRAMREIRAHSQRQRISNQSRGPATPGIPLPQTSTLRSRRHLANMLIASAVIFIACWAPHVFCIFYKNFGFKQYCSKTSTYFNLLLGYMYSAISPLIYWALNHNTLRQSPCAPIIRLRSMQNFLRTHFRSHTVPPPPPSSTNEAALGAFNPKLIKLTPKQYRAQASSHYLY